MVAIAIEFIAGRYHANPWGRHVNEGGVEWPPSPFRLARTVVDCVYRRRPDWSEDRLLNLLHVLSGTPRFSLPPSTTAHFRTYQSSNKADVTKKQKIIDGFIVIDRGEKVYMSCPPDIDSVAINDLESVLSEINYLGRSEAWVRISLVKDSEQISWNCTPIVEGAEKNSVRIACVERVDLEESTEGHHDQNRLQALSMNTRELIQGGFSKPTVLEWVYYSLPDGALQQHVTIKHLPGDQPIRIARFALSSKVLPRIKETLPLAERIRTYLMGIHRRIMNDDPTKVSPLFSGKTSTGSPLKGHRHATILPLDEDGDGRIDHITILVGRDFDRTEIMAIDQLRRIWQPNGRPDIDVVLLFLSESLPDMKALRWVSVTPFVTCRHYRKTRGSWWDWMNNEIKRECAHRGIPGPIDIEWIPETVSRRPIRWMEFVSSRKGKRPMRAYGCIMTFSDPVNGPVSLGSLSHYGLGCFMPVQ